MQDAEKVKKGLEKDIKAYKKLSKLNHAKEIDQLIKLHLDVVAEKMIWAFTTGKDGDNIKNWDDFCRVRGEIVARLHPVQEVRGADAMVKHLQTTLDSYYKNPLS